MLFIVTDNNARAAHVSRARDDSGKKGGCNASGNCDSTKRNNMETLAQGERFDSKDVSTQEKGGTSDNRDGKFTDKPQGFLIIIEVYLVY